MSREKKKIKNSDYLSEMLTNDIFHLSLSEQLLVNIKVGLVFWREQRSSNANSSRLPFIHSAPAVIPYPGTYKETANCGQRLH